MNLLTTFEAIKYFDLARKKMPNIRSVQRYLCFVLGIDLETISKYHINKFKQLRQGNVLEDAIALSHDNGLSDDDIIENIRKNLRKAKAVSKLDQELLLVIKSAENLDAYDKKELSSYPDLASRLFHVLQFTVLNWEMTFENYSKEYETADLISFKDDRHRLDGMDGLLDDYDSKETLNLLEHLKKVSESIYSEILDKEKRYHATSINSKLLTLGTDKALPTYGDFDKKTLPMKDFFAMQKNLFLIGMGGVGKTTLLINELNLINEAEDSGVIPIFLTLTKLKHNNMSPTGSYIFSAILEKLSELSQNHEIKADFDPYSYEQKLKNLFNNESSPKKILLMLDGFNEVSNSAGISLRNSLKSDIEKLSAYSNVQIILTSRPFYNDDSFFASFMHVYAKGIDDFTIQNFLIEKKAAIPQDNSLFAILRIPLFLLMYVSNNNRGKAASTKGGILYEFCNGVASDYNEVSRTNELESLPDYIPLLLDFVMPAIAAKMEMQDTFYISTAELDDIINNLDLLTKPFDDTKDPYFKKNNKRSSLSSYARAIKNDGDKVLEYLTDGLSFLQQDSDDNLFFIHQYIKDYFASVFRLLSYRQCFVRTDNLYYEYAHSLMDSDTIDLTREVALQSDILNITHLKALLANCPDKENNYFIHNLFMITSSLNNNSLAGLTFEGFDLSSVSFSKYQFSDGINPSNFIDCKVSENSFITSSTANKFLRTFTIYDNKPALCEFYIYSTIAFIKITELKSDTTLYTDSLDFFSCGLYVDFTDINEIKISDDNKYLLIYNNEFSAEFFYVFNLIEHTLTLHKYDKMGDSAIYSFVDRDRLVITCDNKDVSVYDMTYKNAPAKSLYPDEGMIYDTNYKGLIDSFTLPYEEHFDSLDDSKSYVGKHSLSTVYSYNDYLIFVYNAISPERSICVYSLTNRKIIDVNVGEHSGETPDYQATSIQAGNLIFFTFGDGIFEFDADNLFTRKVCSFHDHSYFIALGYSNNLLYVVTNYKIYEINVTNGEILDIYYTHLHDAATSFTFNNSCITFGLFEDDECNAYVYRFDVHELYDYNYEKPTCIEDVLYLSNDRILIIYSSGFMAVVNSSTLELIDSFMIPSNLRYVAASYNSNIEQVALVAYNTSKESAIYDKPASLYIIDTTPGSAPYFELITEPASLFYYNKVCYTSDGSYLFHDDMGTVHVYDTDGYIEVDTIEIGSTVFCIKAYDGYIVLIYGDYVGGFDEETMSIMIVDITAPPFECHNYSLQDYDGPKFTDFCANEISPNIFEIIYKDRPVDTKRDYDTFLRYFFYQTFEDECVSDYYQDGILVKCSGGYYPHMKNIYKQTNMTTKFAHIDKETNSYFAMNKHDEFLKINLDDSIGTRLDISPSLFIKNCSFKFSDEPINIIKEIITKNMGIIKE